MRAIQVEQGQLVLGDASSPVIGPDEVLIDVHFSGVNRADLLQAAGHYPPPPGASPIMGLECSGTISQVGAEVQGWSVGDQVCALLAGGGYAEQVAVPAGQLLAIPANVDLEQAAALPEVAATVWSNLDDVAKLSAGQRVLIHGGGSGIGSWAIQWCKFRGATVMTTVGSPRKAQVCQQLGADLVVNYREEDFSQAVREFTQGAGSDIILDIIGAKYLGANLDCLATNGHLVVIGLQGGVKGELNLGKLLMKRANISATSLRSRSVEDKSRICSKVREQMWPAIAGGQLRPVVDQVVPAARAAEAHELLATGQAIGKVVLQW